MKGKLLILISTTILIGSSIQSCKKDTVTGRYSINADSTSIAANGQSTTRIRITVPSNDNGTVEVSTSNGVLILNNSGPANRVVISSSDIRDTLFTLILRSGTTVDANVRLTMRTVSGLYFANTMFGVLTRNFLFAKAKFQILVDSSHATVNPFVTMRLLADPSFNKSTVALSAPPFSLSVLTTTIDTFGNSGKFTVTYPATSASPNLAATVTASLNGVNIDTTIGFFSPAYLVNALTSPLSVSAPTVTADNHDYVAVTFTSNIKQIAGTAIVFSAPNGGKFFYPGSLGTNPFPATLDVNGNITVLFRPDSGFIGTNTINAAYYGGSSAHTSVASNPSIPQLLSLSSPSLTISPRILPAHVPGVSAIHFSSIAQLAGYTVTFTASEGKFLFGGTNQKQMVLDNTGATNVYFQPDTGFVGASYIHVLYYGTTYYLDDSIISQ